MNNQRIYEILIALVDLAHDNLKMANKIVVSGEITKEELAEFEREVRQKLGI